MGHCFGDPRRYGRGIVSPWLIQQDPKIATGAGHHSVIQIPDKDQWYITYNRRPLTEKDGNSRLTCIDRMYFDEKDYIKPVVITNAGVKKYLLNKDP